MSINNIVVHWDLSGGRLLRGNGRARFVLVGALLFLLTLSLLGFAPIQFGDSLDGSDFAFAEDSLKGWNAGDFPAELFALAFAPGIVALILFFDFLRSHTSEKRPDGSIFTFNASSFLVPFLPTALYNSAVFLLFLFFPGGVFCVS